MLKQHHCYSLVLYFFLFLNLINAQTVEQKFNTYQVNVPRCIIQDSFGFIWIGTFDGLLRYDGYTFKHYSHIPFDSTSLSNNWVMELQEAENGDLWIGTFGGGLNYFDQRTEKFTTFNSEKFNQVNNFISKILINEDGSLWLGSTGSGLTWFKKSNEGNLSIKQYKFSDKSSNDILSLSNSVLALYKDLSGIIWIGNASEGLIRFDPDTEEMMFYQYDPGNPKSITSNTVSAICEDDSGNLWLGTGHPSIPPGFGEGLNFFDKKNGNFVHFKHNQFDKGSICSNTITSIIIDQAGVMWIGSWDNFLNSISLNNLLTKKNPEFKHYTNLCTNAITSLYEDRIGNIWIGVFGMELYKIDRQKKQFTFFNQNDNYPESLSHSDVVSLYVDKSGCIWFGTKGLDIYNPVTKQYTHYYATSEDSRGLNDNSVTGILEDDNGLFWITTNNGGINIFDRKSGKFQHIRHENNDPTGLISNSIKYLLKRPNGDLWLGTVNAGIELYHSKTGKFSHFDLDSDTFEDNAIINMCEDRRGTLWVGTFNGGLYGLTVRDTRRVNTVNYRYDPENRESLSCNTITAILQPEIADTNALWIGTDAGLNRFDQRNKTFRHFFRSDGLASDHIMRILEDDQGNIWCATVEGLSVYEITTGKIKSFGKADGLPFTDFSNLGPNATKGPDGKLYFSGVSGTLSFYPDQLVDNPNIPTIQFTDFKVLSENTRLDTSIIFKKSITLTAAQNVFSFDFAALNFTNPEKNQYAYKMDGFQENWIHIGNERSVSFTNLDPGKYVFHVKGSNNHGVWNEEGASINVIILPPWWRTWWFKSIALIFVIIVIYSVYRLRLNKVLQMERMRVQIASDLHDDIGASLTRIAVHSEIIQSTKSDVEIRKSSGRIGTMSREIITTLSDIVWSIDARNDAVGDLLDRMRDFIDTVFPAGSIKIDFQTQGLHFDQKISQDLRQNIYLIFKEAVNNAAKHSDGTEIRIRLTNGTGTFHMEISDNGRGFDLQNTTAGHHGLDNMRMRAVRIGGTLEIESENGTRVVLKNRSI